MKALLVIGGILSGIVAIYELSWWGKSSLAWILIFLAVSNVLIIIYLLNRNSKNN